MESEACCLSLYTGVDLDATPDGDVVYHYYIGDRRRPKRVQRWLWGWLWGALALGAHTRVELGATLRRPGRVQAGFGAGFGVRYT